VVLGFGDASVGMEFLRDERVRAAVAGARQEDLADGVAVCILLGDGATRKVVIIGLGWPSARYCAGRVGPIDRRQRLLNEPAHGVVGKERRLGDGIDRE